MLAANTGRKFSPGEIIRRTLEALSAGFLYSSNSSLLDPCSEPSVNLIADLSKEHLEKVTSDAQTALRLLVFNKLHEFLGVPAYCEAVLEPETESEAQEFEGYDGAPGHLMHGGPSPRMRGMRGPRRPPPGGRFGPMGPYGGPFRDGPMGPYDGPYGGPNHYHGGPGPYGHGPRHFPSHLGPMGGPWRGPPPHMRRGGPHPFGPRGFGGHRMRGPKPNKNRLD